MRTNLKKFLWQWRGILIAAPSITVIVLLLRSIGLLQIFELTLLDRFFILRPREAVDDRIVIVDITEADVRKVKLWPMPDAVLAKLLVNIKAQQPRAIGLDLYRDLQVPPGYDDLVNLFKTSPDLLKQEKPIEPGYEQLRNLYASTPDLFGVRKVAGNIEQDTVSAPPGLKYPDQVAANDLPWDGDGVIRRFYLTVPVTKDRALNENDRTLDGLGVKLALTYLNKQGINPEVLDESQKKYKLGKAVLVPFNGNDGSYINAEDKGYQILLNYRGPVGSFPRIKMTDVLENKIPPQLMRDRIVLIGASARSLNDLFYTPYSIAQFGSLQQMPGVEIHANIASHLLSAAIDGRSAIQFWNEPLEWLWILAWAVVGAALAWLQRDIGVTKKEILLLSAGFVVAGGSLVGGSFLAFINGWWIPVIPPLLAMGGSVVAITAYVAKTAKDIRKTFGRYLTDDVVANLLENPTGAKLGGERRKITILTSDLRGFTATSERLPPEEVVKILNIYLGYMADAITEYKGTIDEFMGDGILVLFGAPTAREDDAERAIACAIAMQSAMIPVNEEMNKLGVSPLKMGIGINTGEVVVGNIGSSKRTKYGVVGSQVNLTYRIESYTTEGQILISQSTLDTVKAKLRIDGKKQVQPKGVKEPITIYDIGGIDEPYNLYLNKQEELFFSLSEKMSLQYAVLDGKHVSDAMLSGCLVELSAKGGKITCESGIPPLTNIKLNFLMADESGKPSEDVYAKVIEKKSDSGGFYIYFSAMPPEIEKMIENLYKSISSGH
ncbi:CHASE2 domain-containing protein [Aerosakkonema funiforme]|uniref:CHASE2 domain-containing protein n=1 Tax=Aerosakkonema funiforme TaxID=1246630 RepID=UPI0035B9CEF4